MMGKHGLDRGFLQTGQEFALELGAKGARRGVSTPGLRAQVRGDKWRCSSTRAHMRGHQWRRSSTRIHMRGDRWRCAAGRPYIG